MEKKIVMYNVYLICCALAEKKVPYKRGQEILFKALYGDLDVLDILPESVSGVFTSIYSDISTEINILTEQEKKFCVENVLKELYFMLGYIEKTYDINLNYIERDRAKYKYILKQATLKVLIDFIGLGVNKKDLYNSFKTEYTKYCEEHIVKIANMLDSKQNVDSLIEEREDASKYLINKYKELDISDVDLRTTYEEDEYFMIYSESATCEFANAV